MKKVQKMIMSFAAVALMVGLFSFTTKLVPPNGDHVLIGDTWRPISEFPNGDCLNEPGICSYEKTGSLPGPQNDQYKNPANFTSVDQGVFDPNL